MTWEIVIGLITLVGFFITVGKIVSANTRALTKLEDSISRLDATLSEQKKEVHALDDKIADHETRITILEKT